MLPLVLCELGDCPKPGSNAAVERFARYMLVRRFSASTQRLYLYSANLWMAAGGSAEHLDGDLLRAFLARRAAAVSPATVNLDIKALRAFYRYAHAFHDVPLAELEKIPRLRRVPARIPRFLSDAEVGQVLGRLPLDTFVGLRDYAMVLTLYASGLRASELAAMRLDDFCGAGMLHVVGKGGHARYVPLGAQLSGVLAGYLTARDQLVSPAVTSVWVTRTGTPLRGGRAVWEIVSKRMWQGLGIDGGHVRLQRGGRPWQGHYPHALRASFATALLAGGCDLISVAQMMGHASVETTARYLGVDIEHLRKTIAKHPRGLRQNGMSSSAKSSTGADDACMAW